MRFRNRDFRLGNAAIAVAIGISAVAYSATSPQALTTAPSTQPLTVGPISYFEDHCARCHGSYGSGYLPESMKRHDTSSLKKLIREMAAGPAQTPLDGADLDAQVAYHQSLLAKSPFIAITENTDDHISGEATPGAAIQLKIEDRIIDVPMDEYAWSISRDEIGASALPEATLILEKDGVEVTLPLSEVFSEPLR